MTASELSAIIVTVAAVLCIGALGALATRLVLIARRMERTLTRVEETVGRAAEDLSSSADAAASQVDRLETIIRTADRVSNTVDGATTATVRALANPVVKGAAAASGTRSVVRRLRGKSHATAAGEG